MGNIRLYGSTSGYTEIAPPAVGLNNTLTLPTDSLQSGLVLITTQAFSAVSAVAINSCFTSTYDNYRIVARLKGSTASQALTWRFRAAGADIYTASYYYNRGGTYTNSAGYAVLGVIGDASNWGVWTADMNFATPQSLVALSGAYTNGNVSQELCSLSYNGATPDGFDAYPSTGNMTGTISIYGYRN